MKLVFISILIFPWLSYAETFEALLAEMIARDPQVKSQRAILEQVRARHLGSIAAFIPRLTAEGSDTQVDEPYAPRSRQLLGMGRLNLFRSGADWASLKATDAAIEREEAALVKVEQLAEADNSGLLFNAIQAAQRRQVYRVLYETNEQLTRIVEARFKRGLTALQEVQKSSLERDNSMARLQDAQRQEASALAALSARLGRPNAISQWPWRQALAPEKLKPLLQKAFIPKAVPRVREAEFDVLASERLRQASRLNFLPSLELAVGYGYLDTYHVPRPGWTTTLNLVIPIFDLRNNATYRERAGQLHQALAGQERVLQEVKTQWESSKNRLIIAADAARARQANVALAKSLFDDNQRRLQQGRSSVNDVAVDQNRLVEAELLAVDGWAAAHTHLVEYCHALGSKVAECR